MELQVRASTAKTVVVWHDGELFHARAKDTLGEEQVCLGVDLFEVIAELAELDLEREDQAAEALTLAQAVARQLLPSDRPGADDEAATS